MRAVMTAVLPEPAPARIDDGLESAPDRRPTAPRTARSRAAPRASHRSRHVFGWLIGGSPCPRATAGTAVFIRHHRQSASGDGANRSPPRRRGCRCSRLERLLGLVRALVAASRTPSCPSSRSRPLDPGIDQLHELRLAVLLQLVVHLRGPVVDRELQRLLARLRRGIALSGLVVGRTSPFAFFVMRSMRPRIVCPSKSRSSNENSTRDRLAVGRSVFHHRFRLWTP